MQFNEEATVILSGESDLTLITMLMEITTVESQSHYFFMSQAPLMGPYGVGTLDPGEWSPSRSWTRLEMGSAA